MKNNKIFTQSSTIRHEYCCSIVQIGELKPIEGKDKIVSTMINGFSMVVRKDQVKEGDIMFYAMNETQLSEKFLSMNNLFDIDCYNLNSNSSEVDELLTQDKRDEAKRKCGFFNKYGRVKLIRLGGIPSYGFIFSKEDLSKVYPQVMDVNLNELVNTDFDTICGEEFVKVYVPPIKETHQRGDKNQKRNKKLRSFNRLIPGKFSFHYDTKQLNREITNIKPNDNVCISLKIHGTSFILGNILTKKPKYGGLYSKLFLYLPKFLQFYVEDYDTIYSSRTVIKNKNINNKVGNGFYGTDIWGEYAKLLDGKIPQGMTIYGEIFGYMTGETKMIQKGYDYGCKTGTNKLMIYRINTENDFGENYEWNVQEVYEWTTHFLNTYPELKDYIHPIDILYHGTLSGLYPEIDTSNHWHENVLQALKNDKEHFNMEMDEPLCKNKVPREGVVIRIDNDPLKQAFKLKTDYFYGRESKMVDNGEVDIEMENGYGEN